MTLFERVKEVKQLARARGLWTEPIRAETSHKTYSTGQTSEIRYTVPILISEWLSYTAAERAYILASIGLCDQHIKHLFRPYTERILDTEADLILGTDGNQLAKIYLDFGDDMNHKLQLVQHKIDITARSDITAGSEPVTTQYYWRIDRNTLCVTNQQHKVVAFHLRTDQGWMAIGPTWITRYSLYEPWWLTAIRDYWSVLAY